MTSSSANQTQTVVGGGITFPTEGYHYASAYGDVSAGTGSFTANLFALTRG